MLLPHEHVEGEAAKESVHWVEHEQEASGERQQPPANVMIMLSQNVSLNLLHPLIK